MADQLTVRKPELLTLSRALACNKTVVDAWFSILGEKITQLGLQDRPAQIFNCDESGLSVNPGLSKIITKRGSKNPVQVIPGSGKEQYTILALASASGKHYPPFVVFAGKHLYDIWMAGGPKGALYGTSPNGWMDTNLFSNWFNAGFLKWTKSLPKPLLLIFDGHMSHISLDVVNIAIQNQIHLLCLPPHCSHLLQPLDVGVFKPLKDEWRKIIKQWYKESRLKSNDKSQFSKLLSKLYNHIKPQLAVAGFGKCGIYPFDPSVIAADKLAPASTFDRELQSPGPSGSSAQTHQSSTPGGSTSETVQSPVPNQATQSSPTIQSSVMSTPTHEVLSPVQECSTPSTPHSAMRNAVLTQLKVCNAAVRQKPAARRRIAKKFGGECLTEEDSVKRLREAEKIKNAKIEAKHTRPKPVKGKLSAKKQKTEIKHDVEPDDDSIDGQSSSSDSEPEVGQVEVSELHVGAFVKVNYESEFYPAEITAVNKDLVQCNCMEAAKSGWRWPQKKDELWYPITDIMKKLAQPIPVTSRGVYKFPDF